MTRRKAPQAQLAIDFEALAVGALPPAPAELSPELPELSPELSPSAVALPLEPDLAPGPHIPKPHSDRAQTERAAKEIVKLLTKAMGHQLASWEVFPRWASVARACLLAQGAATARDRLLAAGLYHALRADAAGVLRAREWAGRYAEAAEKHEADYLAAVKGLKRETLVLFGQALSWALLSASSSWDDCVGRVYEELASTSGKGHLGQFFTPMPVARFMAEVKLGGFATEGWTPEHPCIVYEPACGSGVMMLAAASVVDGIAPQALRDGSLRFVLADLDATCVALASLNAVLHGLAINTVVLHGNSLSTEHEAELVRIAHHWKGDGDAGGAEPSAAD